MTRPIDAICIDDQPDALRKHAGILRLLAGLGHLGQVVEARSVEEAYGLMFDPDSGLHIGTGIIDYNLGVDPATKRSRYTGLDFIRDMYLMNPRASFVLATANQDIEQLRHRVEKMGGYAVPKSVRPSDLAAQVSEAIGRYHAHPELINARREEFD